MTVAFPKLFDNVFPFEHSTLNLCPNPITLPENYCIGLNRLTDNMFDRWQCTIFHELYRRPVPRWDDDDEDDDDDDDDNNDDDDYEKDYITNIIIITIMTFRRNIRRRIIILL
jgi:hypothetical protein